MSNLTKVAAYDYSCAMVKFPTDFLVEFQKKIDPEDVYNTPEGKYGVEDEPHVTILYGLHTSNIVDVQKVIQDTGLTSVTVELKETSLFENKDYDVLKVTVVSPDLHKLNAALSKSLEVTTDYPDYKPHLTIAYLKKGRGKKYAGDKSFVGTKTVLKDWTFSPSKGTKGTIPFNMVSLVKAALLVKSGSDMFDHVRNYGLGDAALLGLIGAARAPKGKKLEHGMRGAGIGAVLGGLIGAAKGSQGHNYDLPADLGEADDTPVAHSYAPTGVYSNDEPIQEPKIDDHILQQQEKMRKFYEDADHKGHTTPRELDQVKFNDLDKRLEEAKAYRLQHKGLPYTQDLTQFDRESKLLHESPNGNTNAPAGSTTVGATFASPGGRLNPWHGNVHVEPSLSEPYPYGTLSKMFNLRGSSTLTPFGVLEHEVKGHVPQVDNMVHRHSPAKAWAGYNGYLNYVADQTELERRIQATKDYAAEMTGVRPKTQEEFDSALDKIKNTPSTGLRHPDVDDLQKLLKEAPPEHKQKLRDYIIKLAPGIATVPSMQLGRI